MFKKILIICFLVIGLCRGGLTEEVVRIDFVDAAVLDVVQTLAKQADLDLVISGDPTFIQTKKTTVHLKDITPEEALDYILKSSGISFEKKDKTILISMFAQSQNIDFQGVEIEVINLKYLSAEKVSNLLSKVIPPLISSMGSSANSLVLQGRSLQIEEAKNLIAEIDKPIPQILIESKVIEISASDSVRLGLDYNNGIFSFTTAKDTKKTSLTNDLTTTLNSLLSLGKANVVANPRITTLDNHEAVINIGTRIPYAVPFTNGGSAGTTRWAVEYIDAGVKLKIIPQIGEEGEITAFIQPEVSSISEWRTIAAGDFPVISTRNASATLRVKNGETIVVGGLLSESDRENISRVPILGQIPGLHLLFQNRTVEKVKTEIVFLITPYVI